MAAGGGERVETRPMLSVAREIIFLMCHAPTLFPRQCASRWRPRASCKRPTACKSRHVPPTCCERCFSALKRTSARWGDCAKRNEIGNQGRSDPPLLARDQVFWLRNSAPDAPDFKEALLECMLHG